MRSEPSSALRRIAAGGLGVLMMSVSTFAGAVAAEAADTSCVSGICTVSFEYTGDAEQWLVPAGVTSVTATVSGGSGGSATSDDEPLTGSSSRGGLGGVLQATVPASAGEKFTIVVGGAGQDGVSSYTATPAAGGYGGGGKAGKKNMPGPLGSGGGGGGSFLFAGGSLVLAAGGGGGASVADGAGVPGGDGGSTGAGRAGGLRGGGAFSYRFSGGGATQTAPGSGGNDTNPGAAGSPFPTSSSTAFGYGGAGANSTGSESYLSSSGAGGGGGFFGGGGGGTDAGGSGGQEAGAGGGGSGYLASTATDADSQDGNEGNGKIVITYDDPSYATATELKLSDNPNDASATVLTATVSPASATGNVSFYDGNMILGSPTLIDGTATLSKVLSSGTHTIRAVYSGDASHNPSGATTTMTVSAYTAPSFDVTSTSDAPITKRVTAGQSFSFDGLAATGTPTPTYTVEDDDNDSTVLPDGVTFTDGTLAGSSTRAGTWKVQITATNSIGTATEYVKLTIAPGTATALKAAVSPSDPNTTTLWAVAPDGTVTEPSDSTAAIATIIANQGDSIVFDTMPVDQYGNPTTRGNVQPVTTSSVDTDTITYDPATNLTTVMFNHASPHTITFRVGGLTNSFTVQVTPTPSGGTDTSTGTGEAAFASNHLATTGSEPFAPLAWALGILALGLMLTAFASRSRARRVH